MKQPRRPGPPGLKSPPKAKSPQQNQQQQQQPQKQDKADSTTPEKPPPADAAPPTEALSDEQKQQRKLPPPASVSASAAKQASSPPKAAPGPGWRKPPQGRGLPGPKPPAGMLRKQPPPQNTRRPRHAIATPPAGELKLKKRPPPPGENPAIAQQTPQKLDLSGAAKPITPGKVLLSKPKQAAALSPPQAKDLAANEFKSLSLGSGLDLDSLLTSSSSSKTNALGDYKMADPAERKQMLIPIEPVSSLCKCGDSGPEEKDDLIHWKDYLPFFAGCGLRSGRMVLGGGGGAAGMGVGSGMKIYDIKKDCALVPFATYDSHDRLVNCITEHPCGSEIATSMDGYVFAFLVSSDGSLFEPVDQWKVIPEAPAMSTDGTPAPPGEDEAPQVTAIEFNNAGNLIATGGDDGKVRVWQYHSKQMELLLDVDEPGTDVTSVAFTSDSKHIVTCSKKNAANVWSLADGKAIHQLKPPSDDPILSKCLIRHVRMVRVMQMTPYGTLERHNFAMATFIDPNRGGYSYLCRMNAADWSVQYIVKLVKESVTTCVVSADGSLVAMSTNKGSVLVYSTLSMACIRRVSGCHQLPGTALCFDSKNEYLVSASMDKSYTLIPIDQSKMQTKEQHGCIEGVFRLLLQVVIVVIIAQVVTWNAATSL